MIKRKLILGLLAYVLTCAPLAAEQHRLQDDFTFKRVGVPSGNSGGRITVQVTPAVQSPQPEAQLAEPSDTLPGAYHWFWEGVSPTAEASKPGRLEIALQVLREAPAGQGVATPRLTALQQIASDYGREILLNSVGTNVSPALVLALIAVESSGRSEAVSGAGASGLMQLMPATAARFGVVDTTDPAENIKGGVAYLAWLMDHFDNDPILALAGYNAGEGAVRDNGGVPPYAETRDYVPKVIAAWTVARALCLTPPELMSDGCVFSVGG